MRDHDTPEVDPSVVRCGSSPISQRSRTRSSAGRAQQMSALPFAGGSTGSRPCHFSPRSGLQVHFAPGRRAC
jgi:hypothetical protein